MNTNIITEDIRSILLHDQITSDDIKLLRKLIRRNCYRVYGKALRDGLLERAEYCQICGVRRTSHGRHKSYLKPLDVTWLCDFHHRQIHSKTIVDNFNLISSLVGSVRAGQIYKLVLPTNQAIGRSVPKVTTITGSVEGDKVLWKARIKYCGKACLKIWEFANRHILTVGAKINALQPIDIKQIIEIALGPDPEKETFVTRAIVRAGIQERMKAAGWVPEEISC